MKKRIKVFCHIFILFVVVLIWCSFFLLVVLLLEVKSQWPQVTQVTFIYFFFSYVGLKRITCQSVSKGKEICICAHVCTMLTSL